MFSWTHLALVVVGGMLGTAARAALSLLLGETLGPLLVPLVNVGGAFALGALLGTLSRRPVTARTQAVRHLVGTGVLAGFTTYSALAVESTDPALFWVGLANVVAGTAAAWAGLVLARRRGRSTR